MSAHMPAPFSWGPSEGRYGDYGAVIVDANGNAVADCAPEDAPLFVAAPDLLAAAKIGLRYFDQVVAEGGFVSDGERLAHESIVAAIARAEGAAP